MRPIERGGDRELQLSLSKKQGMACDKQLPQISFDIKGLSHSTMFENHNPHSLQCA